MVAASFVNRHKKVNKYMVNIYSSSRTFFNMNSVPQLTLKWELENLHPFIKRLFSSNKVQNVSIAGTLKLEEIRSVPLVKKLIRISVTMFWLRSCPTNLHKIIENPNFNSASHKYKIDYLLGRHASNGSLHRGDKHLSRHNNHFATTCGFCNQLEKVCFDTSAGDRIFVAKNQRSQPTDISHRRENTESKNKMSKYTDRTSNIDFRINKSDWLVDINNPSSITSKITMSVCSAAANIIFKGKPFISAKNSSEPPIKNRITTVDNKSKFLQCSIINSASCTVSHIKRCLNKGLGGNLQWYINKGNVVSSENEILHQYSRIISSKTSHKDIHKIQRCQNNTSSSRQYCELNIFDENRGYSKCENGRVGQGNFEIPFEMGDHNYCRMSPKRIKCSSRLGISKQFGLLREDAESSNFSESLPNKEFS